ncbi:hypothetical protein BC941DRAFT_188142 [Chlamydoabsidia padenii]|nr:hypothetical protein BC941DRAFT_188142 [Chlamydoabsidia padenii]
MVSQESELGAIPYAWVDAICVDQMNEARKKETIYRMNDIYDQATYILAVPDLHLEYLKKNPSNAESIEHMQQNALLIYHIMQRNAKELHALDDNTLEEWEVPKANRPDMANYVLDFHPEEVDCAYLLDKMETTADDYANFWSEYNCWASDKIVVDILSNNDATTVTEKKRDSPSFYSDLKHRFRKLKSVFLSHPNIEEKKVDNNKLQQLIIMLQVNKWSSRLKERDAMVRNVMKFFEYLVNDWSDRVWVISEYHISKKKRKLKYWFISFSEYEEDSLEGMPFFELRFPGSGDFSADYQPESVETQLFYSSTQILMKYGIDFSNHVKSTLVDRHFLQLMLKSKASRNPDRFNAVLPISDDYRQYFKNKDTVSSWNISDMVSVRMRVRLWLKAEDNLLLLFSLWHRSRQQVLLPSFDQECMNDVLMYYTWQHFENWDMTGPPEKYNFDFDENSVILIDNKNKNDTSDIRYCMHIQPKQYQAQKIDYPPTMNVCFISQTTWKALELDPHDDELTLVIISFLYMPLNGDVLKEKDDKLKEEEEEDEEGNYRIGLVGNVEKNKWVVVSRDFVDGDYWHSDRRDSHRTLDDLALYQNKTSYRFYIY